MTCVEEIQQTQTIAITFLMIQCAILIVYFIRRRERRNVDIFFLLGLCVLHPCVHKSIEDCGEELLQASVLFLFTSLAIFFWSTHRRSLETKAP